MIYRIFALVLLLISFTSFGQDCDCQASFNWVKETFEANDAGFSYAVESKGLEAYEEHNAVYLEKTRSIENSTECTQILYQWLTFFRSGHIGIRRINQSESTNSNPSEKEIRKQFKDWDKLAIDMEEFEAHLSAKKETDIEGVWITGSYKIGVKQVEDKYIGFIIEADGVYWSKNQVKFVVNPDKTCTYYMRDHSARELNRVELIGKNNLRLGDFYLKRAGSIPESDDKLARYLKALNSDIPYFEKIDEYTTYLRIPSFSSSEKKYIDSVISENRAEILRTENLIIDLRNNGGGSDSSFDNLIPFLYTNPVSSVGVEFLSTELNNQRMLDFISDPKYNFTEEDKVWAQESYDRLSMHLGDFVNLDSTQSTYATLDTVYEYPKSIGILINNGNGSTAEEFLLAAKQSKKVKLLGTTTRGVLDISNMYFVESPCGEFELGYCLTKSLRIPGMTIDDKGIQPDFFITSDTADYEWINFAVKILSSNL